MVKNFKPKYTNDYGLCNQKIDIRLALTKTEAWFHSTSIHLLLEEHLKIDFKRFNNFAKYFLPTVLSIKYALLVEYDT